MSEDFARTNEITLSNRLAYAHINDLLNQEGKSIADFPSMLQTIDINQDNFINELNNESPARMTEVGSAQYLQLNERQKMIVDFILKTDSDSQTNLNNCIYIDGPGGSGKTFIYSTLYNLLRSKNKKVKTMAYT